jgi:competence protein ComEA
MMGLVMIGSMLLAFAAPPAAAVGPEVDAAPASLPAPPIPAHAALAIGQRSRPPIVEHYVDINSAGRTELMTLPGIGAAEADRIVAHRPYLTKTELVTKNVLLVGPYVSLKNLVVAMPKAKPKGKG